MADSFTALGIGISELTIYDNFNDLRPEQRSLTNSGTTRSPLSYSSCDTDAMNAERIIGLGPRHRKVCVTDAR